MKRTLFSRTEREMEIWHWPEQFVGLAISVFALTVMGPFETSSLLLWQRTLFWLLSILAGWVAMIASLTLIIRHPGLDDWSGIWRLALAIVIASVPTSFLVRGVGALVSPEYEIKSQWRLLLNTVFICSVIGVVLFTRVQARLGRTGHSNTQLPILFLDRLPPELGTDLISLSMQDHYVEVTTANGSMLILMRFSDAIDELESCNGLQIHRSHWIAASAFRGQKRVNGKLVAKLSDGRNLPVSRTYAKSVKATSMAVSVKQPHP